MDADLVPEGWYEDPSDPALIRYWDGAAWSARTAPRAPDPVVAPPRPVAAPPVAAPAPPTPAPPMPVAPSAPGPPPPWSTGPPGAPPSPPWSAGPAAVLPPQWPPAQSGWPTPMDPALAAPWNTPPVNVPGMGQPGGYYVPPYVPPSSRSRSGRIMLIGAVYVVTVLLVLSVVAAVFVHRDTAVEAQGGAAACGSRPATALPADLTNPIKAGRPVITPAGAKTVLEVAWSVREQALQSCDLAMIKKLDVGPAQIGDLARAGCGCLIRPAGAAILDSAVYVPRQTTFPAYFMVEVRTEEVRGASWDEIMVFTRTGRKSPWRLQLATGYAADEGNQVELGRPAVDAAGYAQRPDRATASAGVADAKRLATYYQQAKDTGVVPPNPFHRNGWTVDLPAEIAEYRQDQPQRNGLIGHFTYRSEPGEPVFQVLSSGSGFACTALRTRAVYTAAPGGGDPQQTRDRKNWGPELAPGAYRSITSNGVSQTCFLVPEGGQGPSYVLGGDYREESVITGVPLAQ